MAPVAPPIATLSINHNVYSLPLIAPLSSVVSLAAAHYSIEIFIMMFRGAKLSWRRKHVIITEN
ncbi:transmembrane protein, putative [Medicago truncatula]|uniref:Transmembrane protein, putative n=1 Tax=Medicago truncatula TaxID=3880 RepID=G7JNZ7_MEDTR|nr:transmembrane protein, putative [Medicago truncatula]